MYIKLMDRNILLTGFSFFKDPRLNQSWNVVQSINDNQFPGNLIKVQMPGDYCVVADNIKKLWDNYNPILVVHCEMDCNLNKCLSLEQRATIDLNKFRLKDIEDQLPPPDPPGSVLTKDLYSNLNLIDIQEEINREYVENRGKLPVIISESAGRYLGEYLYRCSLKINPNRTILIRLPTYSDTGSFFDVGNCLTLIIDNCICQTIRIAQQN